MNDDKNNPDKVTLVLNSEAEADKKLAHTFLSPSVHGAACIKDTYRNSQNLNINSLISELEKAKSKINDGKIDDLEASLFNQAKALEATFFDLLGRARNNYCQHLQAAEKYMRLALKAQNQCRNTINSLAEVRKPKTLIQNNKAQYQQVNNHLTKSLDHKQDDVILKNELMEEENE